MLEPAGGIAEESSSRSCYCSEKGRQNKTMTILVADKEPCEHARTKTNRHWKENRHSTIGEADNLSLRRACDTQFTAVRRSLF